MRSSGMRTQHFPRELFTKLGELGLLGVVIPEDFGGAGLGYVDYVTILEEIGAADGVDRALGGGPQLAVHQSSLPLRVGRTETGVPAQTRQRRVDRRLGSDRKPGRVGLPAAPGPRRCGTATSGCSTAPRPLSPTPRSAMPRYWWRGPPARAGTTVSRPSSCLSTDRVSRRVRRRTSSACGPPTRPRWFSRTAGCRRTIFWARG